MNNKAKKILKFGKAKPITVIKDKRMKHQIRRDRRGVEYTDPAIASYPEDREVRYGRGAKSRVGHEVGHILMKHKGLKGGMPKRGINPTFLRQELEAEHLSYGVGYKKRPQKLKDIKGLAKDIGLTPKQYATLRKQAIRNALKRKRQING